MTRNIPSTRTALRFVAVVAATLVLASCADDAPLDTLGDQLAGPEARDIGSMMQWILWVCYAIFAAVLGVTIYAWRNFRIKTDDYDEGDWPEQIHGNTNLELAWTAAPAIVLAVVAVLTLGLHASINSNTDNAISIVVGDETVAWEPEVVVIGQQWWWEYQYHFGDVDLVAQRVENLPTADLTTATQMVIPVGEEIELEITSRDVIHSFWIPSLNGKRDAVPGRQSAPWKIQADKPGIFFGQCTEFCGLSHARMRMQVIALPMDEFQEWVTSQMQGVALNDTDQSYVDALVAGDTPSPENSTQRAISTFRGKCASCHLMENVADDLFSEERVREQLVAGAAPNLTHFSSRTTFAGGIRNVWDPETTEFNANDLRIWLQNPAAVKANFAEPASEGDSRMRGMPNLGLSQIEIDDLVALLESTGEKPSEQLIRDTGVE